MSHGIEFDDEGRATVVVVDEGAWHRLTEPVEGPISIEEGIRLAHMADLEYHLEGVYTTVGDEDKGEPVEFITVENQYTTVARHPFHRGWRSIGGAVTDRYVMHTIEDIAEFGGALIGEGATLSALGLIDQGRRMFASFKVREYEWQGDKSYAWLNFYTDFTGRMSTITKPGATRVVCQNTFHIGLAERVEQQFKARHTGRELPDRVKEAREALGMAESAMDEFDRQVQAMIDREVTDQQFKKIVEQFVPIPSDASAGQKVRAEIQRGEIENVWKHGNAKSISGTAWGAYNAMTEWVDWVGGSYKTDEARFVAAMTPGSQMDKQRDRALTVVRKVLV